MFFIDIFYVLLPIIGLIINSIVQIFFLRNLNGQAYFKSIKIGFLCGAISILIFEVIFIIIKFEILINHASYLIMNFDHHNHQRTCPLNLFLKFYAYVL